MAFLDWYDNLEESREWAYKTFSELSLEEIPLEEDTSISLKDRLTNFLQCQVNELSISMDKLSELSGLLLQQPTVATRGSGETEQQQQSAQWVIVQQSPLKNDRVRIKLFCSQNIPNQDYQYPDVQVFVDDELVETEITTRGETISLTYSGAPAEQATIISEGENSYRLMLSTASEKTDNVDEKLNVSERIKTLLNECTHSIQRTIEELLNPTPSLATGAFRGGNHSATDTRIDPSLFIDDEGVTIALNLHSDELTMPQDRESVVVVINGEEITDFEFDAQEKSVDLFVSNGDEAILLDESQQFKVHYREDIGKIIILL